MKRSESSRLDIFCRDDWTCQICGRYIGSGLQPQLAHLIPNTQLMIKKYGRDVIDHPSNVVLVCCLECNNAVQLTNNPVACDRLSEHIRSIECATEN